MTTRKLVFSALLIASLVYGAIFTYRFYRVSDKVEATSTQTRKFCTRMRFQLVLLRESLDLDSTIAPSLPSRTTTIAEVITYCKISAGESRTTVAQEMLQFGLSLHPERPAAFLDGAIQQLVDSCY